MIIYTLKALFHRDLLQLRQEIESYTNEADLWRVEHHIANSGGNLCLHLLGNLQTFIGAVLGHTGYIRNREAEFALKNVPRAVLLMGIDDTISVIEKTLDQLTEDQLEAEFTAHLVDGKTVTTGFFLIRLSVHLGYHLGQVNYHRRLLDGAK